MQIHIALCQCRQLSAGALWQFEYRQCVESLQLGCDLFPPYARSPMLVTIDQNPPGSRTGLSDAFLIRLANLDPEQQFVAQRMLLNLGFVILAQTARKAQSVVGIQCEGQ